jgi:hypothetical protein
VSLTDSVELWVVLVAAVPGVLALVAAICLWVSLRRTRALQRVLLPDRQAGLQRQMDRLEQGLRDLEALSERQGEITERGLASALRFQGMVRYDAYRDMGGQQSWSIALLDQHKTGAVVTSLHARDHARVYLKELREGVPSQRLSPEEQRAVTMAVGTPPPPAPAEVEAEPAT